jgi:hypothetical protein
VTSTHTTPTAVERARRLDNAELEGLITDTVHEDDAADWVDGRITLDELIQRGLDRYTVA